MQLTVQNPGFNFVCVFFKMTAMLPNLVWEHFLKKSMMYFYNFYSHWNIFENFGF